MRTFSQKMRGDEHPWCNTDDQCVGYRKCTEKGECEGLSFCDAENW
jgi:hypothetical protein